MITLGLVGVLIAILGVLIAILGAMIGEPPAERGRVTLPSRLSMQIDLVLADGSYRDLDDFIFSAVRAELSRAFERKRYEEREAR